MVTVHSDHVGSLLRPARLLAARRQHAQGQIDAAALRACEDAAVDHVVELQHAAGCESVTDGEFRRLSFQSPLVEAASGFGPWDMGAFLWGHWHGEGALGEERRARPPDLGVRARLERQRYPFVEEFSYLRGRSSRILKVTLPSPSLLANFWSAAESRAAYPSLDGFLAEVADLLCDEVAQLERLGCRYLQLDAPHYPLLLDPEARAFYERTGVSATGWLARGIELDNAVMAAAPGVTFGFHLCRGNQHSRWLVAGSYEPIAAAVFAGVRAHRLLLEYDDERSGDFAPLRHVPADKMVVLGLVTTKSPRRETVAELARRVGEAARYVAREQLALSPQCGFASSLEGNALSEADQAAKLGLVAQAAADIWG